MKRIFFYSILIFVFSVGIGFFYSKLWKKENVSITNENNVNIQSKATAFTEEKVGFNASFALKKNYNLCGHSKFYYSELPVEIINMTQEELQNMYSDWLVEEFSNNGIILCQNIDDICDEHYVLKIADDNIDVFHIEKDDELKLYKSTGISKDYLTKQDIESLEEGIYVYGLNNLNLALEDFE